MTRRPGRALLALVFLVAPLAAQEEESEEFVPGTLFDRVGRLLSRKYYDRKFREGALPGLVEEYGPRAKDVATLDEERIVVDAFLSRVPASHLALLQRAVHRSEMDDLANRRHPRLGFQVQYRDGRYVVYRLLENGPAAEAGVVRGDRIVAVDGVPTGKSPLLLGSSDDAALPDPPLHGFRVEDGREVELLVERAPGNRLALRAKARPMCALDASKGSARVIEEGGRRLGYVHLWTLTITGTGELVRRLLEGEFRDVDGLLLDLRGRGGSGMVVYQILSLIDGKKAVFPKPVVALVDGCTRSGKEALAWELKKRGRARLVGERTAGALVPASFEGVGQGYVLMYPGFSLGTLTREVERKGIAPDVEVADSGIHAGGKDPILEAGTAELLHRAGEAGGGR